MKKGFKMKLYEGMLEEYKIRHKQVFPELVEQFKMAGVSDYSIWFDEETNYLFAYVNLEDDSVWNNIANTDACKRWWEYMAPLMETNSDNSPISFDLEIAYDINV